MASSTDGCMGVPSLESTHAAHLLCVLLLSRRPDQLSLSSEHLQDQVDAERAPLDDVAVLLQHSLHPVQLPLQSSHPLRSTPAAAHAAEDIPRLAAPNVHLRQHLCPSNDGSDPVPIHRSHTQGTAILRESIAQPVTSAVHPVHVFTVRVPLARRLLLPHVQIPHIRNLLRWSVCTSTVAVLDLCRCTDVSDHAGLLPDGVRQNPQDQRQRPY